MTAFPQALPLTAQGLHCTIGDKKILKGLDLTLAPGEILGILGPNGAGKSTLLRCLAGLIPSEGTIELQGRLLQSLKTRQIARESALMHQNTSVCYPFPASEVVMMGRYPHQGRFRPESTEDRRLVAQAMEFTDTQRLADQSIDTMSGGERQRVLFAKSLAQDTPVLLLDEPSASLDISYQEQIFRYAQKLAAEGKAIVAAVHDLRLAARYCTRVILLSHGEVLAQGSPEEALTPANLLAAYGVRVRVYRNPVTGQLDFHLWEVETPAGKPSVHVIAGGGAGSEVLRHLAGEGYSVTSGVLSPGDSDLQVAGVYGIPTVTSPPFSPIDDRAFDENLARVLAAEVTVLCNLAIGQQNLRNLEAAASARSLVILEDDDPEGRDFTGGPGLEAYRALRSRAVVLKTTNLAHWLTLFP